MSEKENAAGNDATQKPREGKFSGFFRFGRKKREAAPENAQTEAGPRAAPENAPIAMGAGPETAAGEMPAQSPAAQTPAENRPAARNAEPAQPGETRPGPAEQAPPVTESARPQNTAAQAEHIAERQEEAQASPDTARQAEAEKPAPETPAQETPAQETPAKEMPAGPAPDEAAAQRPAPETPAAPAQAAAPEDNAQAAGQPAEAPHQAAKLEEQAVGEQEQTEAEPYPFRAANFAQNAQEPAGTGQTEQPKGEAAESASKEPPEQPTKQPPEQPADQAGQPEEPAAGQTPSKGSGQEDREAARGYGLCGRVFRGLSRLGPFAPLLALACMVWPDFWQALRGEALYCPAEATSISGFLNAVFQQNYFEPHGLAGGVLAAQWPAFTWLAALIALIPMPASLIWPAVGAVAAGLALWGVWMLAHAARLGAPAALAACLVCLCAPLFAPLGHFVGQGALACALVIFALAFFARGWLLPSAWLSLPAAFALTAFAGLAGGLYCLVLPLLASFCFLIWQGRTGRASRGDALFGFGLFLAIIGVWLGFVMLKGQDEAYLGALFANAWQNPWPLPANWWLAGLLAVAGILPWLFVVCGVSWLLVLARAFRTLAASRRENASALIWISLALAWLLAFCLPAVHIAALVMVCLMAILLGKALVNLGSLGNRFFFLICAVALLLAGLVLLACNFEFSQPYVLGLLPFPLPAGLPAQLAGMSGIWVAGAICLLGGLIMFRFVRRDHGADGLVFATVVSIALAQPATLMISPELGAQGYGLQTLAGIEQSVAGALTAPEKPGAVLPMETQPAPAETLPVPVETQPAVPDAPAETPATDLPASAAPAPPEAAAPETPAEVPAVPETPAAPETPAEAPAAVPAAPETPAESAPAEAPAAAPETPAEAPAGIQAIPAAPEESAATPANPGPEAPEIVIIAPDAGQPDGSPQNGE